MQYEPKESQMYKAFVVGVPQIQTPGLRMQFIGFEGQAEEAVRAAADHWGHRYVGVIVVENQDTSDQIPFMVWGNYKPKAVKATRNVNTMQFFKSKP